MASTIAGPISDWLHTHRMNATNQKEKTPRHDSSEFIWKNAPAGGPQKSSNTVNKYGWVALIMK
jgi:hypothetical protein